MKQASTRWKFHFFAQNPKNWQNHDLYSFLFGTEVMMCQKNREGWLVGVWDGDRWDPSHPFRISSHSHPTRRCTVILPLKWAESVSRKGSLKKTRFFGTLVPNIGGWGGWVPNLPRTPPNHPKNRLFWPEFHLLWSQNSRRVSGSRHLGPMEVPLM